MRSESIRKISLDEHELIPCISDYYRGNTSSLKAQLLTSSYVPVSEPGSPCWALLQAGSHDRFLPGFKEEAV